MQKSNEKKKPSSALSKAERKAQRAERNKAWHLLHRSLDSTKDLNPRHTQYYQIQLPELKQEWNAFVRTMKHGLPVSFRVSEALPESLIACLQRKLEYFMRRLKGRFIQMNGEVVHGEVLKTVTWSRQTFAMSIDNYTLAHEQSLQDFHQFLLAEVQLGHIVRQELVSMIPVILLDLKSHHQVLDCCAAPGSKTEQILALMQRAARQEQKEVLSGFIMANDTDPKRLHTLTTRYEKCFIPNMMFSCMDAERLSSYFPKDAKQREQFDRILCDVPCSGDATFRKSPHLWRLFRPRVGIDFHKVQLQIVKEAFKLLKVGGKLVYSTCSLNPMEDEAVVAELLRLYRGRIRLCESQAERVMPGLKYRRGINSWKCDIDTFVVGEDETGEEDDDSDLSDQEDDEAEEGEVVKTKSSSHNMSTSRQQTLARLPPLIPSLHPPSTSRKLASGQVINEVQEMQLDRCLRILPQDQDTGGFFIAVFEKVDSIPFQAEEAQVQESKVNPDKEMAESGKVKNNLQIVNKQKVTGKGGQVTYNANTKQHKVNLLNNSHGMMKELGFNAKVADSAQLVSFVPHKVTSLAKCCEFPLLNFFSQYIDWKQDLITLEADREAKEKTFIFVQRTRRKTEKNATAAAAEEKEEEDASYIDPSELIMMPSSGFHALHSWAKSVPILQFGFSLTCHPSKVNTKGFALNPYAHVGLQQFSRTHSVHITMKDFVEMLKLICIKSSSLSTAESSANPFAKEVKRIVTMDYFEDLSVVSTKQDDEQSEHKAKALYMQHEGLERAAHIAMDSRSLQNISQELHRITADGKKTQFLLYVNILPSELASTSSSSVGGATATSNAQSVLGKRRLSKAEKKKLAKQKQSHHQSKQANGNDDNEDEEDDNEEGEQAPSQQPQGGRTGVDNVTLVFWVSALEDEAKDSAIDFSSHWLLLTPSDVCQSFSSILN